MPLSNPTQEDERKIHSEINQIVNQRITITTLAVTIFGVVIAWVIPSKNELDKIDIIEFTFFATYLLVVILFFLFLLTHHLTYMLRLLTSYLIETKKSYWEIDWDLYRNKFKYWGYTKPIAVIFLLLGFISLLTPFFISSVFDLQFECYFGFISAFLGIVYIVIVVGMGFCKWFAKETKFRKRWEELNK